MGKCASKLCKSCLVGSDETKEYHPIIITTESAGGSESSRSTSKVTSIYDQSLETAQANFFATLEEEDPSMEKLYDKNSVKVLGRDLEKGFFLRSEWTMKYSAREFLDFFCIGEERVKWDKNLMKIETKKTEDRLMTYSVFKKMPMVSQRDLLVVSKEFIREDGIAFVSCSVQSEEHPPNENYTRMNLICGGYFIQKIDQETSHITSLTKCDFGGNIPSKLVKSLSASNMNKFIQALINGLDKYYNRNN